MEEPKQLELPHDPETEFLLLVQRIIKLNGLKVVAGRLGMSEQALSHAITRATTGTGKRKRHLPMEKIWLLLDLRGGPELVAWQAKRIKMALIRELPATVAEKYEGLLDAVQHELGGHTRKGLLRAADESIRRRRGYAIAGEVE